VNHLLSFAVLLAATTKKSSSSSSVTFLIFIVIVVAALYFLFLRPNQQKAKRQRQENASISVGDKVVTIGGIVGTIEEMQGDRVVLLSGDAEVGGSAASPTRLVFLRTAIARKVDAGTVPAADDGGSVHEDGAVDHQSEDSGKAEGSEE
jgi:preprotein translocase subunit YajC